MDGKNRHLGDLGNITADKNGNCVKLLLINTYNSVDINTILLDAVLSYMRKKMISVEVEMLKVKKWKRRAQNRLWSHRI